VVLVMDHYVPERRRRRAPHRAHRARLGARPATAARVRLQGICHVVVPQHGHIRPGLFCVGGDSHSPTGGAFGAYMFGIGSTEMLGVVTTGEIWVQVPRTHPHALGRPLARGVAAKDMMLAMIGRFGMNGGAYQALEFAGEAVRALPMQERMTLANMSAELGAQVGLIAPDEVTRDWLALHGRWTRRGHRTVALRRRAPIARNTLRRRRCAAGRRALQPGQRRRVEALRRHRHPGRLHRRLHRRQAGGPALRRQGAARQEGRGRRAPAGRARPATPTATAPARRHHAGAADAGAQLLPSACGICAGYGDSFGRTRRHLQHGAQLQGPHGAGRTLVYLASPYTVAASAIAGRIADPREVLP
jgi:3-isopropylmalate/(R)-2-methylmalate dehydratase large subunit